MKKIPIIFICLLTAMVSVSFAEGTSSKEYQMKDLKLGKSPEGVSYYVERSTGKPANGNVTIEFEGNTYNVLPYVNGVLHGKRLEYYPTGELKTEKIYVNGKENGMFRAYYKDGTLKTSVNYVENEMDGELTWFTPEGKIDQIFNYKLGIRHGPHIQFFPNGNVNILVMYDNGKETLNQAFKVNGILISERKEADGPIYIYNDDGSLHSIKRK